MFTCSCIRKLFKKKQKKHDNDNDDNNNNKITYDITPIPEEEESQENVVFDKKEFKNIYTVDDFNEWP